MQRLLVALALGWLIVVPAASAKSSEDDGVLIRDPKGDAGPGGVGLPAGSEWLDLVDVSLVEETNASVRLKIRVAGVPSEPAAGELGVHFRLGEGWWIVGWTTIAFPAPPFVYRGGFFCPSDAYGNADPNRCDGFDATVAGGAYFVTMNRTTLDALDAGITLERPKAYGDVYNRASGSMRRRSASRTFSRRETRRRRLRRRTLGQRPSRRRRRPAVRTRTRHRRGVRRPPSASRPCSWLWSPRS